MSRIHRIFLVLATALALAAGAGAQTGFPFQNESLRYSVNWPSGLSLGDASFTAHRTEAGWNFEAAVSVAVPGFPLSDKVNASAASDLCSIEFERDISHGPRKSREKTTFDQKKGAAHRVTVFPEGGGQSDFDIPACARDALTFVYYARKELGQGRVPPQQQVYFGAAYSVRMEYAGAQTITSGEKPVVTDRVTTYVKGPKADFHMDIYFARDAARTPLSIRAPLAVGTLSMDLVR